jgi:hypothetical protein
MFLTQELVEFFFVENFFLKLKSKTGKILADDATIRQKVNWSNDNRLYHTFSNKIWKNTKILVLVNQL